MSAPSTEPLGWDDQFIPETGNPLSALDAYDNKCVFLTGATGFVVGKGRAWESERVRE